MPKTTTSDKEVVLEQIVSAVGEQILETVPPTDAQPVISIPPPNSSDDDFIPTCITESPMPKALQDIEDTNIGALMLGLKYSCPRWVPGSVIKWATIKAGFNSPADADYAAQHLNMACQAWNDLDIGVTFEWVLEANQATFALWFGGDRGRTLASAFFPNPNGLSNMLVYSMAFSSARYRPQMWKVFMHELGHVLGLRHEFALDIDPKTGKPERYPAVQFGERNSKSLMTYGLDPPEIQPSDIESTKKFYRLKNGDMIGLTPVEDFYPM